MDLSAQSRIAAFKVLSESTKTFSEDDLLPLSTINGLLLWISVFSLTTMTSSRSYNEEVFGDVNEFAGINDVREESGQLIVGDGVCTTNQLCLGCHP